MGCLSSKEEKAGGRGPRPRSDGNSSTSNGGKRMGGAGELRRNSHGLDGQSQSRQEYSTGQGGQDKRASLGSTNGSTQAPYSMDQRRSKERVVTDPRGGHRVRDNTNSNSDRSRDPNNSRSKQSGKSEGDEKNGFSSRNQFDRASQLRRSKKRKKGKELNSTQEPSSPKTASEIVDKETEKNASMIQDTSTSSSRTEYHSKYGNLI